jgi:hypothetical protein
MQPQTGTLSPLFAFSKYVKFIALGTSLAPFLLLWPLTSRIREMKQSMQPLQPVNKIQSHNNQHTRFMSGHVAHHLFRWHATRLHHTMAPSSESRTHFISALLPWAAA